VSLDSTPSNPSATLRERHGLPSGLLDCEAHELLEALGGPTLIHLPGRRQPPVFASVLLHGNETTGWETARSVLRHYQDRELPRGLSLFIGNVAAASSGVRVLPGQPDYNRIWRHATGPEADMAAQVRARMVERGVFASVDIHNNTGSNPHYGCINRLDPRFLNLATLFSRTVVYFTTPAEVQSNAFAELGPAITVECGRPGHAEGTRHATHLLEALLHLAEHPADPPAPEDYDLYHTVATVKVRPEVAVGFEHGDLVLRADLDHLNFTDLPPGTGLGEVRSAASGPEDLLTARDEHGREVVGDYFTLDGAELRTRLPVMPSMLTRDADIIRQDCLCYLMERFSFPEAEDG
jgi:succinylglutamate desuccinylase